MHLVDPREGWLSSWPSDSSDPKINMPQMNGAPWASNRTPLTRPVLTSGHVGAKRSKSPSTVRKPRSRASLGHRPSGSCRHGMSQALTKAAAV